MVKKINIPIYDSQVNVYIGNILDNLKKINSKFNINVEVSENIEGMAINLESNQGTLHMLLIEKDCRLNTLVHECLHVAWDILDDKGVMCSVDNQEPLAYLTDYIFDKTVKYI